MARCVNRTLEKIDKLVLTGLFSRTVVEENGILLLEPTASCRKLLFKNRDNKYLHAILFDPYAMLSCFCFSKKYLEYVPEANALEDCCNKMKKDRFVENYDENSFKTFDNVVSEILEKASKNGSSDSQEFLLSSSL